MASIGWDRGQIYSTSVLPGEARTNTHAELIQSFAEFVQKFRVDNSFVYRYCLQHACGNRMATLRLPCSTWTETCSPIISWQSNTTLKSTCLTLLASITNSPKSSLQNLPKCCLSWVLIADNRMIMYSRKRKFLTCILQFERGVKECAKRILFANPNAVDAAEVPDCQVMLKSDANVVQIRDLTVSSYRCFTYNVCTDIN